MSLMKAKVLSIYELQKYRTHIERILPTKGTKDFTPNNSWIERKQLEAALFERQTLLQEERVERVGVLSVAEWDERSNVACVVHSVGRHWESFGHQRGPVLALDPEEALFLLETSNLLLLHNEVGLSVQQGYNTLLSQRTGCTVDNYRVYSHLARQGFRLRRHRGPVFVLTDYERRIGLQSYLYPLAHKHHKTIGFTNCIGTDSQERAETKMFEQSSKVSSCGEIDVNSIKPENGNYLPGERELSEEPSFHECSLEVAKNLNQENNSNNDGNTDKGITGAAILKMDCECVSELEHQNFLPTADNSRTDNETLIKTESQNSELQTSFTTFQAAENEDGYGKCQDDISSNGCNQNKAMVVEERTERNGKNSEAICGPDIPAVTKRGNCVGEEQENSQCGEVRKTDGIEENNDVEMTGISKNSYRQVYEKLPETCVVSDSSMSCHSDSVITSHPCSKMLDDSVRIVERVTNNDTTDISDYGMGVSSCHSRVQVTDHSDSSIGIKNVKNSKQSHGDVCITLQGGNLGNAVFVKDEIEIIESDSEVEENSVPGNTKGPDIICIEHKETTKRKRQLPHKRTGNKNKKHCVVDLETGSVVESDSRLFSNNRNKKSSVTNDEVIVVDISNNNSKENNDCHEDDFGDNTVINIQDKELEQEISRFYEEITLIDLTGDDGRTLSRTEILESFPNFAGVNIATVTAPPAKLLPGNLTLSREEYIIDVRSLVTDRASYKSPSRGRYWYQRRGRRNRGNHRRSQYFRGQEYQNFQQPDEFGPWDLSVSYPHFGYEAESFPGTFPNNFKKTSVIQSDVHAPVAVIDTFGSFMPSRISDYTYGLQQENPDQQWYNRNWVSEPTAINFTENSDHIEHYTWQQQDASSSTDVEHTSQRRSNRKHQRHGKGKDSRTHYGTSSDFASSSKQQIRIGREGWRDYLEFGSENIAQFTSWAELKRGTCNSCKDDCEISEQELKVEVKEERDQEENSITVNDNVEVTVKDEVETVVKEEDQWKPLLAPADCTDVGNILKKLQVFQIPNFEDDTVSVDNGLKIMYDLYLPTTKFKKGSAVQPDYRLCIVGCEDEVPSAGEISFLLKDLRDNVPLLFAIVIPESVVFYHFADVSLPVDDSCPF